MATVKLTCPICGKEKEIPYSQRHHRFCSRTCARSGPNSNWWKGGRRIDRFGYVTLSIGKQKVGREHILIAEKALGKPLPEGVVVHHHDGNRTNNQHANLVICENQAFHLLLHKRLRVLKSGGDPDKDKLCCMCKQVKRFAEFNNSSRTGDGLTSNCSECAREYMQRRRRLIAQ